MKKYFLCTSHWEHEQICGPLSNLLNFQLIDSQKEELDGNSEILYTNILILQIKKVRHKNVKQLGEITWCSRARPWTQTELHLNPAAAISWLCDPWESYLNPLSLSVLIYTLGTL